MDKPSKSTTARPQKAYYVERSITVKTLSLVYAESCEDAKQRAVSEAVWTESNEGAARSRGRAWRAADEDRRDA